MNNLDLSRLGTFPEISQNYIDLLNRGSFGDRIIQILGGTIFIPEYLSGISKEYPKNRVSIQTNMQVAIEEAMEIDKSNNGKNSIVLGSAIDPNLKDRFFGNPEFITLAGTKYNIDILNTIGTTQSGYHKIMQNLPAIEEERIPEALIRNALKSERCKRVVVHALGPEGTNISQVARNYIKMLGIENKSEVIVYESGIEPQHYSNYARDLQDNSEYGTIHLHVECAVFYGMRDLYEKRSILGETVFADEHHMKLDNMQLVVAKNRDIKTISAHPSPTPLLKNTGFETIKASSNSSALIDVIEGRADGCITTQSSFDLCKEKGRLIQVHSFGSPNMTFTIGTPLNIEEIKTFI